MFKLIIVTGGVLSGLGKGTVAASIAKLMQWRGFKIKMAKIDPYLNVDAGTMNPIEHGEVFVTEEVWEFEPVKGFRFKIAEIDQDFGTYERFTGLNIHPSQNITSGQIYLSVVLKERRGDFLGKTVQIIPHITNEIKSRIMSALEGSEVGILEVGGTVGDIEAMPYLEAIRQLRYEMGSRNTFLVHVTYVPFLKTIGQLKTKPTQHSVYRLMEMGLIPDAIIARGERELDPESKRKISLLTGVSEEAIISCPDLDVVYAVPLVIESQGLGDFIVEKLGLKPKEELGKKVDEWERLVTKFRQYKYEVKIGLVGKYTKIKDSYVSINEALKHAGAWNESKVELVFIDAENYDASELRKVDGILLTPGFGRRASEGMIKASIFALKEKIPFLGICFGAQLATVGFARYIMGWSKANSTEIDPSTPYPVVDLLPEQKSVGLKGGSMRLGGIEIELVDGTTLYKAYGKKRIVERFRHRYHINKELVSEMSKKGFKVNAVDVDGNIVGFEVENHPFFIGVQWHPEYKSRPFAPSPPYKAFIEAVLKSKKKEGGDLSFL